MQDPSQQTNRPSGIYSFKEFMQLELEEPQPAMQGLLVEGQNGVLVGPFAIGKTLLSLQISTGLAMGSEVLGRKVLRPYKVAFLDCENGEAEIQKRLSKQINLESLPTERLENLNANWIYVNARDPGNALFGLLLNPKKKQGFSDLERFLDENQPEILIIDNLGRVLDGEIEDAEDVRDFFDMLSGLRVDRPYLRTVLFLHHLTKQSDRAEQCSLLHDPHTFLYKARGSGRLLDFSEIRLAISEERVENDSFFVVNGVLRSGVVEPLVLQRNDESLSFELHSDKEMVIKQVLGSPRRREIWEAICTTLPTTFRFGEAAGLTNSEGKQFNRGKVNETLRIACANQLLVPDPKQKGLYHRSLTTRVQ